MTKLMKCVVPAVAAFFLYACTPVAPSSAPSANPSTAKGDNTNNGSEDFGSTSPDFSSLRPADFATASSSDFATSSPADFAGTTAACGTITNDGTCVGAMLEFCDDSNQLTIVDCSVSGGCIIDSSGFADCKEPK